MTGLKHLPIFCKEGFFYPCLTLARYRLFLYPIIMNKPCSYCSGETKTVKISDYKNGVYATFCTSYCNHKAIEVTGLNCDDLCSPSIGYKVNTGGHKYYLKYCKVCNDTQGTQIAKSKIEGAPDFIGEAVDSAEAWKANREVKQRYFEKCREESRNEFFTAYSNYLSSEKWKAKRGYVLSRDKYVCQGCLNVRATEVHHIHYDNVGDELYCDLVSLCNECHNRHHDNKSNDNHSKDFIKKWS